MPELPRLFAAAKGTRGICRVHFLQEPDIWQATATEPHPTPTIRPRGRPNPRYAPRRPNSPAPSPDTPLWRTRQASLVRGAQVVRELRLWFHLGRSILDALVYVPSPASRRLQSPYDRRGCHLPLYV